MSPLEAFLLGVGLTVALLLGPSFAIGCAAWVGSRRREKAREVTARIEADR